MSDETVPKEQYDSLKFQWDALQDHIHAKFVESTERDAFREQVAKIVRQEIKRFLMEAMNVKCMESWRNEP